MFFKVTTGDIFYTIPASEGLREAEDTVANLCREQMITYDNEAIVSAWLDAELEKMRATGTGFHFLILRDIAQCSQEAGYPIVALGNLSGSLIAYLLGITEMDPFEYYTPEMVWGSDANPITPDCTIGIAPQVRPLLPKYLDARHGFVAGDKELFRQISLIDVHTCEQLGALEQATGKKPSACDLNHAIYLRVASDILEDYSKESGGLIEGFKEDWSFHSLLRLFAFTKGTFDLKKLNLNDPNFFATRDEFFNRLVQYGIPADIALDIVKKGVWSSGTQREKYVQTLQSYHVPKIIMDYFDGVGHLWTVSACIDRLLHQCYVAWYQEYFPEAFM